MPILKPLKKCSGIECFLRIGGIISILCLLGLCALAQDKPGDKIKYQLEPNGVSFSVKKGWNNSWKMLRMQHSDEMDKVLYDTCFNRGIKRGRIILATGDKPRFALLYSAFQSKLDPDMVKMGDGRFRISVGNDSCWLDELKPERIIFNPSSTEYRFADIKHSGLEIQLLISQNADRGAVARLRMMNQGRSTRDIKVECLYGGLRTCNRTFSASYFSPLETENLESNRLVVRDSTAFFSDSVFSAHLSVRSLPASQPIIRDKRMSLSIARKLMPEKQISLYYEADISFDTAAIIPSFTGPDLEKIIQMSREHYDSLLSVYQVQTPDTVLSSAFKNALLNFDDLYTGDAWLEGIHWWSAYWTNNFQIGAAVSLGQWERAGKALRFYSRSAYGPCPILKADGYPDVQSKNGEDGLPYFINNLIRYFNHTGDTLTVTQIWPALRSSIDALLKSRDEDGNGLINWHLGANAFMYQADHLEMPGDAASPSIMMAGMLDKLSQTARRIGQYEDAVKWEKLSAGMYGNLLKILWNNKQGAFYNHKDEQGILHTAHYYSDLVFPALYTGLPEIFTWQSLDYLSRAFWTNNCFGERTLMRVGEFKPSIFGNDNVMPVQMTEAARAYFKMGDKQSGIRLMHAVALAATVFTEAPGNFPERMNDEGKGEANYLFGNPVGSFLDAFITGLFGLQLKDAHTLSCEPRFPESWDHASLKLPYASMQFRKIKRGPAITLMYDIWQNKIRNTDFFISTAPCRSIHITCNHQQVDFKTSAGLQTTNIRFRTARAARLHIVVEYTPESISSEEPVTVSTGQAFDWKCPYPISAISDPQNILESTMISSRQFRAIAGKDTGWHSVYIQPGGVSAIVRLTVHIESRKVDQSPEIIYRSAFKNDSSAAVNLADHFNTNEIYLTSRWRNGYALRDSAYLSSIPDSSKSILKEYGYINRSGYSMAMVCKGLSDPFTTKTVSGSMPDSLSFNVHRKMKALSFLWLCETQSRNSSTRVGSIRLKYTDGSEIIQPIVVGENLDASWKYFASLSEPVFLRGEDFAKTYTIRCNPLKELASCSISLIAADVQIGLMGVNMILTSDTQAAQSK